MPHCQVVAAITARGGLYHLLRTWHPQGQRLTLFAVTPNGLTVQLHNMALGNYTPSGPVALGHDGLCSVGAPACSAG